MSRLYDSFFVFIKTFLNCLCDFFVRYNLALCNLIIPNFNPFPLFIRNSQPPISTFG